MAGTKQKTSGGGRRAPHANPVKLAKPGEDDILCGKDRACALHKGSQRFRAVIDSYRATYQKAVTKYDKMCITKEIYEVLSQKARFLKYNDAEKLWEEITPLQGRDKIGHALRFANNHNASNKTKRPSRRKAVKRQGSFSSTSATSATSSAITSCTGKAPSKAELVKNLVEVAKEEPKVMDAIVDHLTFQDALAATAAPHIEAGTSSFATVDGGIAVNEAKEAAVTRHQRVASIVDPVTLENIAYGVECNSSENDAALDELISLLNHDDTIAEEDIQDLLDLAEETGDEVPPTIAIVAPIVPPTGPNGSGGGVGIDEIGGLAVPSVAPSSSGLLLGEVEVDATTTTPPAATIPVMTESSSSLFGGSSSASAFAGGMAPQGGVVVAADMMHSADTTTFAGGYFSGEMDDQEIWAVMKEPILDLQWE